uniref:Uncharacterized protein n=1 Tax=Iridovirus LCIVAC01 TaxID=2506607 RepID=A0A481YQC5_9VIRU|nr:MAG: hypothetical protein LCIVAC01_02100 [Iridovirus LCIVAC01]
MEYASRCDQGHYDQGYYRHVGWANTTADNPCYKELFSKQNLNQMSDKITELLQGVNPKGRSIIVPKDQIAHVISQVFTDNRPKIGDIHTRYIIGGTEETRNDVRDIIDRSINTIVTQIRNQMETAECNKKLTIWTTVLGDFNRHGLRSHSFIKIRKRRSDRMMFNMNY